MLVSYKPVSHKKNVYPRSVVTIVPQTLLIFQRKRSLIFALASSQFYQGRRYDFHSGGAWALKSEIGSGSNSKTHYFMKKWGPVPPGPPGLDAPVYSFLVLILNSIVKNSHI